MGFGPLRFDANGRLTVGLGFGLERVAEGAAVDTDALAGDGLEVDGPTGKLKARLSDQLVFDNGANAEDRGQGLVHSLVAHQGLGLQMVDGGKVKLSLALLPPGAAGEPVPVQTALVLSAENEIDLWLAEQRARGLRCACGCGRKLDIQRRHYWRGLPEFHAKCRSRDMQRKRRQLAEGFVTGQQLAEKLGIGRTTVRRWVRSGKLPGPTQSVSGMLLFPPDAADGGVS